MLEELEGEEQASGKETVLVRLLCPLFVPRNGFTASPSYSQLVDVWTDRARNPSFVLAWFVHQLVILRGRNLGRHADGLKQHKAWKIEEHDGARTPREDETVITSIEFVYENITQVLMELRGLVKHKPEKAPRTRKPRKRR